MEKDEEIFLLKSQIKALKESYEEIIKIKNNEIKKLNHEIAELSIIEYKRR